MQQILLRPAVALFPPLPFCGFATPSAAVSKVVIVLDAVVGCKYPGSAVRVAVVAVAADAVPEAPSDASCISAKLPPLAAARKSLFAA